jgi:hypothetical protein
LNQSARFIGLKQLNWLSKWPQLEALKAISKSQIILNIEDCLTLKQINP